MNEDTLIGGDNADTSTESTDPTTDTLIGGESAAQTDTSAGDSTDAKEEPKEEPSDWTLDVPEGWHPEAVQQLVDGCKAIGLSKEQGEKVMAMRQQEDADFLQTRKGWRDEIKADPDFGGEHMTATITDADRALAKYDESGEVRKMLRDFKYGDNPAVIRMMARIGRTLREDNIIPGHGGDNRPLEDRLYSHH